MGSAGVTAYLEVTHSTGCRRCLESRGPERVKGHAFDGASRRAPCRLNAVAVIAKWLEDGQRRSCACGVSTHAELQLVQIVLKIPAAPSNLAACEASPLRTVALKSASLTLARHL
jgi:hypothetical protein